MSRAVSLVAPFLILVACGSSRGPAAPTTSSATVSDRCPDLAKVDELASFDFAKEYALSRSAAEKLRAAALSAEEIGTLSEKLDAELGIACAQIAHDLGNKGDWRSGNEACAAAIKQVGESRAKLGAKAQTKLVVRAPVCLSDAALVTKCASICDSSVPAGKVRAECEQKAGRCDGSCDGSCEPKVAVKCDGTCSGLCEGQINGTCGGRCVGKCDGKRVSGACLGTCVGSCDHGAVDGECKGQCTGSCKLAKASLCDGTCSGSCTVELAEAKCAGEFKTPEVSSDCRARCDLAVINNTECSTPQVGFVVTGAAKDLSDTMKGAIDRSFPALLKILDEVGTQGPKRVLTAQAVIESTRTSFRDMARSGGNSKAAEAQLARCFDEPFKKAVAAATAVKTGIDQASSVRDEATGIVGSAAPSTQMSSAVPSGKK